MIGYIKETFKAFVSKQVFILAAAIWTIDYLNLFGLEKLNIKYLSVTYFLNFIEYVFTIFIYQQLLVNEINVVKMFKKIIRFFFLQLGIVLIAFAPYIITFYIKASFVFDICTIVFAFYFFTRLNILLPMLITENKISIKSVWSFTKEKIYFWPLASVIFTLPFLLRIFLNKNSVVLIIIASVFYILIPIFQCVYYKKKAQS